MIRKFFIGTTVTLITSYGLVFFVTAFIAHRMESNSNLFIFALFILAFIISRLANHPRITLLQKMSDKEMANLPKPTKGRVILGCGVMCFWSALILPVLYFSNNSLIYQIICGVLFLLMIVSINFLENTWRDEDKEMVEKR